MLKRWGYMGSLMQKGLMPASRSSSKAFLSTDPLSPKLSALVTFKARNFKPRIIALLAARLCVIVVP